MPIVLLALEGGFCEDSSALSVLSLADQKLSLSRRHLSDEALEKPSFFDPSGHLLTELARNMQSSCPPSLLPSQQCRFMDRTFPRATARGIATPFLTNRKRCLNERFDLAYARENAFPRFAGQCGSCHMESIYTFHILSTEMLH